MNACPILAFRSLLAALAVHVGAVAQCDNHWFSSGGISGSDGGTFCSVVWDPDGSGPALPVVVFGGDFDAIGTVASSRIATFEPVTRTWETLGDGCDDDVRALAVTSSGDLIAGGTFSQAGGVSANRVARWDGAQWHPLGGGPSAPVRALLAMPNGDVIAAGQAGGSVPPFVERWDGTSWTPLGAGQLDKVFALAQLPNGDIVAGGRSFSQPPVCISRWDGTSWTPFGTLSTSGTQIVYSLLALPNGDLIAGGRFDEVEGVSAVNIARWSNGTWSALGAGIGSSSNVVNGMALASNGDVLATGVFGTAGGNQASSIAGWNGSSWSSYSTGINAAGLHLTALPNGEFLLGGAFTLAGTAAVDRLARWNGVDWEGVAESISGSVLSVTAVPGGVAIVGGAFDSVPGTTANNIAAWDGTAWQSLGTGTDAAVSALATLPNGEVIAGGAFTTAGGVSASHIARWDGTGWQALGAGTDDEVESLHVMPNGDVVALGPFTSAGGQAAPGVARWDGAAWHGYPVVPSTFPPITCTHLPGGDLLLSTGVAFGSAGELWRFDGTSWSMFSSADGSVLALHTRPNGDVVAGGYFLTMGGVAASFIARHDGTSWSPMGGFDNVVYCVETLAGGDLAAGGLMFAAGRRMARWDGSSWSELGGGADGLVADMCRLDNGDLMVAGSFQTVGGAPSPKVSRLTTGCRATATVTGSGCAGSGGNNTLTASNLPWLGTIWRAVGEELPTNAFVAMVYGFATIQLPWSQVLPQAGAGCDLLVNPEYWAFTATTTGSSQSALAIPSSMSLIGTVIHHQLGLFEFDATFAIVDVSASNALAIAIGSF